MPWSKTLNPYKDISQLNADPSAAQKQNNCGPACTSMNAYWVTGKYYDPESITQQVYGDNYVGYTGWDVDTYFWAKVVKCQTKFYDAGEDKVGALNFIKSALQSDHPVKTLMWYSSPGVYGHFRNIIGSYYKIKENTRYIVTADPWTGANKTFSEDEFFNLSQWQFLEVCGHYVSTKYIPNKELLSKYTEAYRQLYGGPHATVGKGKNIELHVLKQLNKLMNYERKGKW